MTHNLTRTLILAACSAAISLLPASAATLDTYLNAGGTASSGVNFTDGDKTITFTGYTDTVSCFDPAHPADACTPIPFGANAPLSMSAITVNPSSTDSQSGLDLYGFTLSGSFKAQSYQLGNGDWIDVTNDIKLNYTVTATAGLISDLHLALGGEGLVPTGSVPPEILVSESTIPNVGTLTVTDPGPNQSYALILSPSQYTTSLKVTKDITLESGAGVVSGLPFTAQFSALEQSFSEVPEPRAYAAVLGLFFAAFFVVRRRRQQTA